ncbi:MAG: succinyldiaminopimelate transaminase [Planctomycetota bacterium]|jgi:LL-diaminopimelate aminotransferase|nr:succinyldiaminopimelate transaminase [Planctomycetota bacterium]
MNEALRALRPYPMAELQRRKASLRDQGIDLFDFGTGDPIEPTPPMIRQALIDALPTISQYPSVAGTPALRSAVADYFQRRFAVSLDASSQVLPSAGSKESIFHLPLAMLDPASGRDTVIYGSPAYPVYQAGALFAGGREHVVTLKHSHGFRLDLTALPSEVLDRSAIAWINYPHNPTGACVDLAYLREQAACCREHGILLASDECYADLWFDDAAPPPSLLQVTKEGILVFGSCSKRSGMTGYRSGFIAGDAELIASFRRWRAAMGVGSPTFIEAAATVAWGDDAHPAERRAIFSAKRALLCAGLAERGIDILPSEAGLYIWATVPSNGDADAYAARCLDAGIVISPGGFFGNGGDGFFRLALVPSLSDCERALAIWPS